jgi:hypothetical protein
MVHLIFYVENSIKGPSLLNKCDPHHVKEASRVPWGGKCVPKLPLAPSTSSGADSRKFSLPGGAPGGRKEESEQAAGSSSFFLSPRPFLRAPFISHGARWYMKRDGSVVCGIVRNVVGGGGGGGTLGAEGRVEIEEAVRRRVVSAAPCRQGKFQSTVAPV